MRENKTTKIDVRMSQQEKEKLKAIAAERGLTISEFVRAALYQYTAQNK